MYFPYLRGREAELDAVTSIAPQMATNQRVIPIIEPVNTQTNEILKTLKALNFYKVPYILVVNPQVGPIKDYPSKIESQIDSQRLQLEGKATLGYLIHAGTKPTDVEGFVEKFNARRLSFIHDHNGKDVDRLIGLMKRSENISHQIFIDGRTEYSYQRAFDGYRRVLVQEGFNKATSNAEFPPDELYSDLHLRYKKLGFYGFGDFTITGKKFGKGGIPHTVAIHLTYLNSPLEALRIKHFLSDRTKTSDDPGGKFLEALVKLIKFLDKAKFQETEACKVFRTLYAQERFPGLPDIKFLSIKHHLEVLLGLMGKR